MKLLIIWLPHILFSILFMSSFALFQLFYRFWGAQELAGNHTFLALQTVVPWGMHMWLNDGNRNTIMLP